MTVPRTRVDYILATGELIGVVTGSSVTHTGPLPPGVGFLFCEEDEWAGCYVRNGVLTPMGERPSLEHDFDYEAREWVLSEERAASFARARRDRLLQQYDWVTLRAYDWGEPVPQEWRDYFQALRDITEQPGFPTEVVWPEAPTG